MTQNILKITLVVGCVLTANATLALNSWAGPKPKKLYEESEMAGMSGGSTASLSAVLVTDLVQGAFAGGEPVGEWRLPAPDFGVAADVVHDAQTGAALIMIWRK